MPRTGHWVEVRSAAEILATIDEYGDTDRMPFMPEMLKHAGRRYQVTAVAHKTCDTIHGTGGRSIDRTLHLADLRCDGVAHGGCQAQCLLFWKTDWLKPVAGRGAGATGTVDDESPVDAPAAALLGNCRMNSGEGLRYRCQATRMFDATRPLAWWDLRQYWRDVHYGNTTLSHALSVLFLACVFNLRRLPVGYRFSCWLYDRLHRWIRGQPDPHPRGAIPTGSPTPDVRLGVRVGDVVEIRSQREIEQTVSVGNRNRGLTVDEEMTIYCGQRRKVAARVERIINERTGEMMTFSNPCIVLEGAHCLGEYARWRLMCPRRITTYWREAWLKPVGLSSADGDGAK